MSKRAKQEYLQR